MVALPSWDCSGGCGPLVWCCGNWLFFCPFSRMRRRGCALPKKGFGGIHSVVSKAAKKTTADKTNEHPHKFLKEKQTSNIRGFNSLLACHNSCHWLKLDLHILAVLLSVLACSTILILTQCVHPQKFSLAWAMIKHGAKKLSHSSIHFIKNVWQSIWWFKSSSFNLHNGLCYEKEATASLTQTKWLSMMNQNKDVSWHHPFYFYHVMWVRVIFMSNTRANLSFETFSHVLCFESPELRPQLLKWVRDVPFFCFLKWFSIFVKKSFVKFSDQFAWCSLGWFLGRSQQHCWMEFDDEFFEIEKFLFEILFTHWEFIDLLLANDFTWVNTGFHENIGWLVLLACFLLSCFI